MRKTSAVQKAPFPLPDVATKVVPAPTDGWDAISPLAEMDPKRAPILDNWVPRPGFVELRAGYATYTQLSPTTPVETLMVWRGPSSEKLFAIVGGNLYDATNALSPTLVTSHLSSSRWQYVNFTPAGAATVIQAVNGIDALMQYNGSAWTFPSITGLPGGRTSSSIINIASSKRRLWYVLFQTSIAAFMPTDTITGAIAGTLDLGALWSKGGYLVAIGTWTIDGGDGPNDYTCFISSRGQVSLYSGTDPTNSSNWTLVGTFDLPPPIGRRCFLRVGSDVAIITTQGVLPISQALPFDPSADRSVAITSRIQNAMAQATAQAQFNFGWQLIGFPAQQLAVLNVPLVENVNQVQFVENVLTGAWCRFTGWNANCFELFNENLYWGDNVGNINRAYVGGSDNLQPIATDMQCAFNYFDDPGRLKRVTMVQPLLVVSGTFTPTIQIDADFNTSTFAAPLSLVSGGAEWDVATWDVDVWPPLTTTYNQFLSAEAMGHALAVHMKTNISPFGVTSGEFDVATFDLGEFDASAGSVPVTLQVNAFNVILEFGGYT